MEYGSADGHICMCCFEYKFKIIDVDNNEYIIKEERGDKLIGSLLSLLEKIRNE